MINEFAPFASDFYVNQRINLKMDLPMRRDTVLALFDRVRKELPGMDRFRRYERELALESRQDPLSAARGGDGAAGVSGNGHHHAGQQWLAVRKTSIRSGSVNPPTSEQAYRLHKLASDAAPYFLDITALDIDHVEMLYGFDFPAVGNHDAIVFNAFMSNSPLAEFVEQSSTREGRDRSGVAGPGIVPVDFQPLLGVALTDELDVQAHIEIKTRTNARQIRTGEYRDDPISVYLIVRKYGPFADVRELPTALADLRTRGEHLVETCIIPRLLKPIRDAIAPGH